MTASHKARKIKLLQYQASPFVNLDAIASQESWSDFHLTIAGIPLLFDMSIKATQPHRDEQKYEFLA